MPRYINPTTDIAMMRIHGARSTPGLRGSIVPAMQKRNWRRTSFRRLDGTVDVATDDWSLLDDAGRPLARIYLQDGGPQGGRWAWFVQVAPDGTPWNGGTGYAASGREAREISEQLVPPGTQERRARM
ncbi:hypothetical protein [Methylocystis sp. ATCC 49242]|uniref:hypothetical protein n=1 Tax=Methylocystis sp. ATCC 49242 TaxID=622637 RepID=UPI0001F86CDA|nr:hypothetical protein [Methylocystis sp. ATCC 49242]